MQRLFRPFVQQEAAEQVCLVRLRVYGMARCQPIFLVRGQGRRDLLRDGASNFALQRKHVPELTIEALRPEVRVAFRLDQLGRHADPVSGASDRSLDDRIDPELAGNVWQRLLRPGVLHGGGA